MASAIVERAKAIIFSMEGNYGTVVSNDCGALSIGCVQWHAGRAKGLLQMIIRNDTQMARRILPDELFDEIQSNISWNTRTVNSTEKTAISTLLTTEAGKAAQNALADNDIQAYINHIMAMGFSDEEIIIFLADIENQGGAGASSRIGNAAIKQYGTGVRLEQVLTVACNDSVFKKYKTRRNNVYKKLTANALLDVDGALGKYTISALQKFLKVTVSGVMDKGTIMALQTFLNLQL